MGLIFTPLSVIAFSTLATHSRTEAAGMYSLLRALGGSWELQLLPPCLLNIPKWPGIN